MVVDLKDCFFTIPLAKHDQERFAFSLPSPNSQSPLSCYQWRVLPQEMIHSPTVYQYFVHQALLLTGSAFLSCLIYHYMNDILLTAPTQSQL